MPRKAQRARKNRLKQLENSGNNKDGKQDIKGAGYAAIIKENENFEKYYKIQKIVPEGEWELFMHFMRQNLPTTFRITGYKSEAKVLLKVIEGDYFSKLANSNEAEDSEFHMFSLPWYPDKFAWQMNLTRKIIRKTEAYERLHNFLISETAGGNISRQEAVSMIPPLVLDVQPHHKVLDMCAAPGSKTAQLIEMVQANDKVVPDGLIIANDANNKRCYMLVHQAKRLQSPCLLIINHDAGAMPNISIQEGKHLKFDRILCDVPCSGDGTMRKNIDIWTKWNLANCVNYHHLQARILKRGLELLEVGGRLVYSTCSLCPVEDESVIHHILASCKDSVELVDVAEKLPGLKSVPGLSDWKIMTRDLTHIASPADIPEKDKSQIKDYMFPPSSEDAPKYNLHRCMRILPHHQNTGGFFVAVLEKVALLPSEVSRQEWAAAYEAKDTGPRGPPNKKRKLMGYREDPYVYFKNDEKLWPEIQNVFQVDPSFDHTLMLTRSQEGRRRTLYFTNKLVKEIITRNEDKLKIINTGIKLFCRCDNKKLSPTEYRLTQEGLLTILPYLKSRVVPVQKSDVIYLLSNSYPVLENFSEQALEDLKPYNNGSLALVCEEDHDDKSTDKLYISLCAWKGANSLRAYVPKDDKLHFLRLCGVDTFVFEPKKFKPEEANDESGLEPGANENNKEENEDKSTQNHQEDDIEVTDAEGIKTMP